MVYIPRQIEDSLREQARQFPAVALTGPRQSGKSTLLKHLFGRTHAVISFDDPVTREMAQADPKLLIESAGANIIFDEIQYVPGILSYLKIIIDQDRHKTGRFLITGSQQFNLIRNLGDTLAGRIALFDLLPFGIEEKKRIESLKNRLTGTEDYFVHSSLRGSFPEITTHPDMDPVVWYSGYVQTYLERDIRTVYNVGILREFQQFLRLLAIRCSQILNLSSLASETGVSVNTVKKWISILEASRIIYILPPYYRNMGKRITKSPKVYFLDLGLVCYLAGIKTPDQVISGPLAGALFENFVMQETVKYFINRGMRPNLYYARVHNNIEIDLIIESGLRLFPFEIKLTKTPHTGMAGHIERFKALFDKLKIEPGGVISLSSRDVPLTRSVSVISFDSYFKNLGQIL